MTDLERVAQLRNKYEEIESLILETPHAEHGRIVYYLRKIQRVTQQLDSLYRKLGKAVAQDIASLKTREEIVDLEQEIDRELKTYSQHFLSRALALAEKMIAAGHRGTQLNQLLAAMKALDFDIGSLEEAALDSLKKERKVKEMKPVRACIFINMALINQ